MIRWELDFDFSDLMGLINFHHKKLNNKFLYPIKNSSVIKSYWHLQLESKVMITVRNVDTKNFPRYYLIISS